MASSASGPDRQSTTTAFNGGEGAWVHGRSLFFTTKGNNRVDELQLDSSGSSSGGITYEITGPFRLDSSPPPTTTTTTTVPPATTTTTTAPPSSTVTLVSGGSTWRYVDNGSNQGTAWRAFGFDDGAWRSGPAPLGYGDPVATVVSYRIEVCDDQCSDLARTAPASWHRSEDRIVRRLTHPHVANVFDEVIGVNQQTDQHR